MKQKTIMEAMQQKYDNSSTRLQVVTHKMAMFIASNNVPNSIVEITEFKHLVETGPGSSLPNSKSSKDRKRNR